MAPRRRICALLPALALLFAALVLGPSAAAAEQPAPAAEGNLRTAIERLVRMPGGPPGVAVTLRSGTDSRFLTAGVGNLETGARWRPKDHMRIASVAKAFSGATALSLLAAGKLSLTDRIQDLLPWLPPSWSQVTVAEALQHTSGLPDYSNVPAFKEFFADNLHRYISPRQIVDFAAQRPLGFEPGSRYHYSNSDNIVIGLIAAELGNSTYSQVLRQRVLDPLRMPSTSLPTGFRLPNPHVEGYQLDPPAPPAKVTTLLGMSGAWASGGIQSTAADLNRFARGYLDGSLFGAAVQRQQLRFVAGQSHPPGPGVNSAGLGIFRYRTDCGTVYGHTGNLPGFTQFAAASRDGSRALTVSVNAQVTPEAENAQVRRAFHSLRRIFTLAVCAT